MNYIAKAAATKNAKIKKFAIGEYLLVVALFFIMFTGAEIAIIILAFMLVICARVNRVWFVRGFRRLSLLGMIPLFGLVFASTNQLSNIVKDVFYFSLPIVSVLFGWMISRYIRDRRAVAIFFLAGALCSLIFLAHLGWRAPILPWGDLYNYRKMIGYLDMLSLWCPILLFVLIKMDLLKTFNNIQFLVVAAILGGMASFATLSRTNLIIVIAIALVVLIPAIPKTGVIRRKRRLSFRWGVVVLAPLIVGLLFVLPGRHGNNFINDSIGELFTTQIQTKESMTQNYRAYESAMAIETWSDGNIVEKITGRGLGKLVDLKFEVQLLDNENDPTLADRIQFIPILHNGYLYIIVKTGIVGLLFFLYFLKKEWRNARISFYCVGDTGRFDFLWAMVVRCFIVVTVLGTFVVSGPYNKGAWLSSCVLLGVAMGRRETLCRQLTVDVL